MKTYQETNLKEIMTHWLTNRARKIEKDNLKRNGESLSFISIERILSDNAVIETRPDKGTMIINIDRFKKNQEEYLKTVKEEYLKTVKEEYLKTVK